MNKVARADWTKPNERLQRWLRFFVIGGSTFLTASACQHQAPNLGSGSGTSVIRTILLPKLPTPFPGVQQLTQLGENLQGHFTADGAKILFVSRLRASHKHSQVYELQLPAMTERRLTYHDGDDADPALAADGAHFYYTSGTDELKEESFASEKLMRTYYPEGMRKITHAHDPLAFDQLTEIYWQSFNGREIERLTDSPGYDGEMDANPKSTKHLVFTSNRDGIAALFLGDAKAKYAKRISDTKLAEHGARYSPDGRSLVWSRTFADGKSSQLLLADGNFKHPRELIGGGVGLMIQPSWHPDGGEIVFSSNRDGKYFNLYSIDREGRCLRRLTTIEMDQTQPSLSPDGQRILFTGRKGEAPQLFVIDYKPTGPCAAVPLTLPATTPAPSGSSGASVKPANGTPASAPAPTATPAPSPSPIPSPGSASSSGLMPAPDDVSWRDAVRAQ